MNILAQLPNSRFQYFSLTNVTGQEGNADLSIFFSEQNLRWRLSEHSAFYINAQVVLRGGPGNDALRLGIRWLAHQAKPISGFLKKIRMQYALALFCWQAAYGNAEKWMVQAEHVYRINLIPRRLYIGGFADQNMNYDEEGTRINWVSEHQIGLRTVGELYVVAEYRINEYQAVSTGWGIGLEYKVLF